MKDEEEVERSSCGFSGSGKAKTGSVKENIEKTREQPAGLFIRFNNAQQSHVLLVLCFVFTTPLLISLAFSYMS